MCQILRILSRIAVWLTFILLATPSRANPIQIQFGGVLVEQGAEAGATPGTRFSGTLSYDPVEAGVKAASDWTRVFDLGQSSGLTFQVAGKTVYSDSGHLQFEISEYPANYGVGISQPQTIIGIRSSDYINKEFFLELRNDDRWVSPFSTLPTSLMMSDFSSGNFVLSQNPGGKTLYFGSIGTMTVVPEPTCVTVFCLLAAGCLIRKLKFAPHRRNVSLN